ncbi:hypothetical protein DRQ25_04725 [Candidatus Fermentibacteria bacterium]|nr:MAG: hypothetical protein DRQ25_04725 [Candidatus Fermentibacteria bacterium]
MRYKEKQISIRLKRKEDVKEFTAIYNFLKRTKGVETKRDVVMELVEVYKENSPNYRYFGGDSSWKKKQATWEE